MSPDSTTNDEEEKKEEEEGKDSEGDCEMKEATTEPLEPSENKENPPQNEESTAEEEIKQTSLTEILLEHTPSSDNWRQMLGLIICLAN